MVDLFFRIDGQNYAAYLCYFLLFFVNFKETHQGTTELLKLTAISVARSFIPANRCAVDKTLKKHLCDLPNLKQARAGGVPAFQVSWITTKVIVAGHVQPKKDRDIMK